jgi:hypothetical protein
MNQTYLLLARLERGPITPMEALKELGIFRLGARVYDLKRLGHKISKQMIQVPVRRGEVSWVAQYRLEQKRGRQA